MTQNEKDLLLKDLCARLPYEIKAEKYTIRIDGEFVPIANIEIVTAKDILARNEYPGYTIKPYLFPLSSMTEEQKKDIFHNGKFYIDHHNSLCRFPMYEDDYDFVTMEDCLEIFNKLNKYHFDYRGLIPMGLAEDATGLNIY